MRAILLSFVALLSAADVSAIEWCHDYVFYVISKGQDSNGIPAKKLREELTARGYGIVKVMPKGTVNESSFLKKGDVLIFNEAHSGIVADDQGRIDHFLQKYGTTTRTPDNPNPKAVTYSPEEAIVEYDPILKTTLLRRGWTIQQIRSFTYSIPSRGLAQAGPGGLAAATVEVWRPTVDLVVNVLEANTNKKIAEADVRVRSISAGTEVVAVLTDVNGSTGKLAIPGDRIAQGLQVRAKSKDHKENWSDVTRGLLDWKEERSFTIYLEPSIDSRLYSTWRSESKFGFEQVVFRRDGTATYTFKQGPPYPQDLNFTNTFKILINDSTGLWIELWDPTKTHRRVFRFVDGKVEFVGFG